MIKSYIQIKNIYYSTSLCINDNGQSSTGFHFIFKVKIYIYFRPSINFCQILIYLNNDISLPTRVYIYFIYYYNIK